MKLWLLTLLATVVGAVVFPAPVAWAEDQPAAAQATADRPAAAQTTANQSAIPPPPGAQPTVMIPAGTTLHVRLGNTLTDKTNKVGDKFTGQLAKAVIVDGKEVLPTGSTVEGHIAYIKPSGRFRGKAGMRIVLDDIITPDDVRWPLIAPLEEANAGDCAKTGTDDEGTIQGCGKSTKKALKQAALGAGIGAAGGLTVGLAGRGGCDYYGCYPSSGPGVGASVLYGAGIGAGTTLLYNLFKHEKHIILIQGTELTFVLNRSTVTSDTSEMADTVKE
jgi:hypothetical protein